MLKILLIVIEILFMFFFNSLFLTLIKYWFKKTIQKILKISQQLDLIVIRFEPLI